MKQDKDTEEEGKKRRVNVERTLNSLPVARSYFPLGRYAPEQWMNLPPVINWELILLQTLVITKF